MSSVKRWSRFFGVRFLRKLAKCLGGTLILSANAILITHHRTHVLVVALKVRPPSPSPQQNQDTSPSPPNQTFFAARRTRARETRNTSAQRLRPIDSRTRRSSWTPPQKKVEKKNKRLRRKTQRIGQRKRNARTCISSTHSTLAPLPFFPLPTVFICASSSSPPSWRLRALNTRARETLTVAPVLLPARALPRVWTMMPRSSTLQASTVQLHTQLVRY